MRYWVKLQAVLLSKVFGIGIGYWVFCRYWVLGFLSVLVLGIGIVKRYPKVLVLVLGIVKGFSKVLGIGIGFKFLVLSISGH